MLGGATPKRAGSPVLQLTVSSGFPEPVTLAPGPKWQRSAGSWGSGARCARSPAWWGGGVVQEGNFWPHPLPSPHPGDFPGHRSLPPQLREWVLPKSQGGMTARMGHGVGGAEVYGGIWKDPEAEVPRSA